MLTTLLLFLSWFICVGTLYAMKTLHDDVKPHSTYQWPMCTLLLQARLLGDIG